MVIQLPERDQLSMSYEQMTWRLTILMGGMLLWIASAVLGPIYDIITRLPV